MTAAKDNRLHIVPRLAVADPKTVAEALVYEVAHDEREIIEALAKLIECNRNEAGQNISAVVATATLPVNRQPNYLFEEQDLARKILSHLSPAQIDELQNYNARALQNPEPGPEIKLIREMFGTPAILQPNEGNSYLANFLRLGKDFANSTPVNVPETKPEIEAVSKSWMSLCMLSMCLKKGFLPLMRHDGSHIHTGYATTVKGEIYNQTHDFAANTVAQYGVIPTIAEQRLNRRVIYSFYGLPQKLPGLGRDWKEFVDESLETWRTFLVENPEYVDKWGLTGLLDENMRMVKPDGTPIISEQTEKQQIPVVDYTDVAVLRHLRTKLESMLTDEAVYSAMPYDDLYRDTLISMEILAIEHILRDGVPPVFVKQIYDACATHKEVRYGDIMGTPQLTNLSSPTPSSNYRRENVAMERKRSRAFDEGLWCGYLVDCGQDTKQKMWVTESAPCIHVLYPDAITIYRVTMPMADVRAAERAGTLFGGVGYLTNCANMKVNSVLSQRDEKKIPRIGNGPDTATVSDERRFVFSNTARQPCPLPGHEPQFLIA